ncbi:DUF1488 domain-containing protein [Burkholderia vietnamiensis]|uniref:DUF1488 family protein n=1 Tax=Burkholderia TaxID=32008 RepID=UPI001CF3888E|nr:MULTISPECIES: DUF1488 family protein [Burkholderia]MCA8010881.1 DUF1488 domain-containing protein [Burkholderia vietnamiensis]UXU90008.1 DUF1488 domain-containing protein [Burkholderia sp. S-53]HDR8937572.1 DUF1488 family protein [Burkholderia vietnamiensis]HDR9263443.1 DUF1488 family protein [Burkholderia vietnamiensis]
MEVPELHPRVTEDGRSVAFMLPHRGREVACHVTRDVLEQHFWVQPGASETRILQAFVDGRRRLVAMAERKMLAHRDEPVVLTMDDFGK